MERVICQCMSSICMGCKGKNTTLDLWRHVWNLTVIGLLDLEAADLEIDSQPHVKYVNTMIHSAYLYPIG
jgi:hypothetical protein